MYKFQGADTVLLTANLRKAILFQSIICSIYHVASTVLRVSGLQNITFHHVFSNFFFIENQRILINRWLRLHTRKPPIYPTLPWTWPPCDPTQTMKTLSQISLFEKSGSRLEVFYQLQVSSIVWWQTFMNLLQSRKCHYCYSLWTGEEKVMVPVSNIAVWYCHFYPHRSGLWKQDCPAGCQAYESARAAIPKHFKKVA